MNWRNVVRLSSQWQPLWMYFIWRLTWSIQIVIITLIRSVAQSHKECSPHWMHRLFCRLFMSPLHDATVYWMTFWLYPCVKFSFKVVLSSQFSIAINRPVAS
ncbi:hypothetical protein V8E55_009010 [Tylopilus felleus]